MTVEELKALKLRKGKKIEVIYNRVKSGYEHEENKTQIANIECIRYRFGQFESKEHTYAHLVLNTINSLGYNLKIENDQIVSIKILDK